MLRILKSEKGTRYATTRSHFSTHNSANRLTCFHFHALSSLTWFTTSDWLSKGIYCAMMALISESMYDCKNTRKIQLILVNQILWSQLRKTLASPQKQEINENLSNTLSCFWIWFSNKKAGMEINGSHRMP